MAKKYHDDLFAPQLTICVSGDDFESVQYFTSVLKDLEKIYFTILDCSTQNTVLDVESSQSHSISFLHLAPDYKDYLHGLEAVLYGVR